MKRAAKKCLAISLSVRFCLRKFLKSCLQKQNLLIFVHICLLLVFAILDTMFDKCTYNDYTLIV